MALRPTFISESSLPCISPWLIRILCVGEVRCYDRRQAVWSVVTLSGNCYCKALQQLVAVLYEGTPALYNRH